MYYDNSILASNFCCYLQKLIHSLTSLTPLQTHLLTHPLHHLLQKKDNSLNGITNTNSQSKKPKTIENENKETASITTNLNDSSTETNNQTNPPQTRPSHKPRKRQLRPLKKNI